MDPFMTHSTSDYLFGGDLTGRDSYVIHKALLYAICHIQNIPEVKQEWSDMVDMCLIVRSRLSLSNALGVRMVELHTGENMTLWPEEDDELTGEERLQRDKFAAALQSMREQYPDTQDISMITSPPT